ncbi:MAG: hypothetical protein AB1801_02210 [Chloroflexota bacterium]
MNVEQITQVAELITQIAIIAAPIVFSWFIQNYRKSVLNSQAETQLATIVRLTNVAIDYVEDLDKRGDLEKVLDILPLPAEIVKSSSKGIKKLGVASHWLESELQRAGIGITDEKAREWVSAEFRKRVGDVKMGTTVAKHVQDAVTIVQNLDQNGLIELSPTTERFTQLAGLAADWVLVQLDQDGVQVPREDILARTRAELLRKRQAQIADTELSTGERLTLLAEQAVRFLEGRQIGDQLSELSDKQLAAAWVLTEALKQGLNVKPEQIADVIDEVLGQRRGTIG